MLQLTLTLSVRHGRDTANPKATTRVIADTAAPAKGGYICKLATTPQPSIAKAIPYRTRNAALWKDKVGKNQTDQYKESKRLTLCSGETSHVVKEGNRHNFTNLMDLYTLAHQEMTPPTWPRWECTRPSQSCWAQPTHCRALPDQEIRVSTFYFFLFSLLCYSCNY